MNALHVASRTDSAIRWLSTTSLRRVGQLDEVATVEYINAAMQAHRTTAEQELSN